MPFPVNPSDGDTYITPQGVMYKYYLSEDKWKVESAYTLYGVTGAQGETGSEGKMAGVTGILQICIENGSNDIDVGAKCDINVPHDLRIYGWKTLSEDTGSIGYGVWSDSYDNFPPTSSDSMHAGSTGPYIKEGIKNKDEDLSDWGSPTALEGDIIRINVDSVNGISKSSLALYYHWI